MGAEPTPMLVADSDPSAPMSPELEHRLIARARAGNRDARDAIIEANIGYVVHVARAFATGAMTLDEAVSEGQMGLLEALERFDPAVGVRFLTYARWWIRYFMQRALGECGHIVRQPLNRLQDGRRLRGAARRLAQELGREPGPEEVAAAAGLSVLRVGGARGLRPDLSFDVEALGIEGRVAALGRGGPRPDEVVEADEIRRLLAACIDRLAPRQRYILTEHFGLDGAPPRSLSQIGQSLGLTRERVRQLRNQAMAQVRRDGGEALNDLAGSPPATAWNRKVA